MAVGASLPLKQASNIEYDLSFALSRFLVTFSLTLLAEAGPSLFCVATGAS